MGFRPGVWLMVCAGCFDPKPPQGVPCGDGESCPAGLVCELGSCVTPGSGGGVDAPLGGEDASADAVDAAPCVAACSNNDLVCGTQVTTCTLGCSDTDGAHCMRVVPSNGLSWPAVETSALTLSGPVRIDSATGEIFDIDGAVAIRAAGTGVNAGVSFEIVGTLGVLSMAGLVVAAGADVRIEGSRPLALVVDGDVAIDGVLDVSGGCTNGDKACAGAGGGTGGTDAAAATGCGRGVRGDDASLGSYPTHSEGGGGAGAREAGATGAGGTAAGPSCGSATLVPLTGGSGGGRGGGVSGGDGGGGGGALQITAAGTITVSATGVIDAGGAGGQGDQGSSGGGGGGGSGGSLLLEAAIVRVLGVAAANGGAGGGHDPDEGNGEDARRTTAVAKGPPGDWGGGDGGTGGTAPTTGRTANDHGGGGGGAAGRIRVLGATRDLSGVVSPGAATGTPAAM